jgi:FHS family L-fucose permease-like MFS transporter
LKGINNLGTTIGPLIVSFAICDSNTNSSTIMSIESVKIPYLILGFILDAVLLKISSLPDKPSAIVEVVDETKIEKKSAMQYPQLVL